MAKPSSSDQVKPDIPAAQKAKGIAKMAGGAALVAAGVPMCVLPGPGVAAIAAGAALASKGQREFSGREATAVEAKLDAAAEKLGAVAKDQAGKAAHAAASKAGKVAGDAAHAVAEKVPEVAGKAARVVAQQAPKVAGAVVDAAAREIPKAAGAVSKVVGDFAERGRTARREKAMRKNYFTMR